MMTQQKKFGAVRRRVGAIELEVCRRDDQYGAGPCFSVYKHGREALRFDLFPVGAHFHSYRESGQPRHYFAYSGESFVPAEDHEPLARKATSPPWDVLVPRAIAVAAREFEQIDRVADWLRDELAARRR